MVNVGLGWSSLVGIALAASGLALYFLRSFRPKLARDHDIFFAAVALLCGGILFFQGWRQDPILQFGQFLLTTSAIFFAVESIRLRGAATEQAKRNTPIVDDERPVSKVYRAELDEFGAFDDRTTTRRIRGSRDARPNREEYEENARRRPASPRASLDDRYGQGDRSRRRPRTDEDSLGSDFADDDLQSRSRIRGSAPARPSNQPPASRPRRPRPEDEVARSRERRPVTEEPPSEYVDYRPIDNDETDNWGDE
ncbi:Ycf66 family protein [Leptolyngbyaceae cyanobacterium JSC-12]|nr:Ycf66 family protein [Leptolyngbyaceae cyanobacterium JSC-12]